MEKLIFKQITKIDDENLNTMTTWMYNWWGKKDGLSFDAVKCIMEHSLQKNRLPQTYGLFLNGKIIGMFQFTLEDVTVRPDIYPWLDSVYIDEKYRGKGFGRKMLENVAEQASKKLPYDEIYLFTNHKGLYEKFGWKIKSDLDTINKSPRIQKLYKLNLKKLRGKSGTDTKLFKRGHA